MLHAVPELLDALEARLVAGEDPGALLLSIRWSELVGWPTDQESLRALKLRISSLQGLVAGLQAPLRVTLNNLASSDSGYSRGGTPSGMPAIRPRLHGRV